MIGWLPRETDLKSLSAKDIIGKIDSFYEKLSKCHGDIGDEAEGYFLKLLREYPVSMCAYNMTEELKLVIALVYFSSKPKDQKPTYPDPWPGYSYEDLAVCFDRSKATIHEAIIQKEAEARALLASMQPRQEAKERQPQQLIEEDKRLPEPNDQKSNRINEQSRSLCERVYSAGVVSLRVHFKPFATMLYPLL